MSARAAKARESFILAMARLARDEPAGSGGTEDDLADRVLQYAASARPWVTRQEVENALRAEAGPGCGDCDPAKALNTRTHTVTDPQARALAALAEGPVYPGNGISLATARALEMLPPTRYVSARGRTRSIREWVLRGVTQ